MVIGSPKQPNSAASVTASAVSRRDVRIVQFLALPGVIATVLYVPAIDLVSRCRRLGTAAAGAVEALFTAMTICLLLSWLIWPFTLVRLARIRERLGWGTIFLILFSLAPLLVAVVFVFGAALGYDW